MANQGRPWDAKLEVSSICTKLLTKHIDTDSSAAAFICCGLFLNLSCQIGEISIAAENGK